MDASKYNGQKKPLDVQVGGSHYKNMVIQPTEYCQKNELNFCESAVVKYVSRHNKKNGAQDIHKAIHFLHLLLTIDYSEQSFAPTPISDFALYQEAASETAIYPVLGHPIVYPALGLAGEAGEVAEKVKKMCRDNNCQLDNERIAAIKKELGDVLWYVSEVARQAGLSLKEVADENIKKLALRQKNGTLQGSGDNREEKEEVKLVEEEIKEVWESLEAKGITRQDQELIRNRNLTTYSAVYTPPQGL